MHTFTCKNCKVIFKRKYHCTFCSTKCSIEYNKKHKKLGGDRWSKKYLISKFGTEEGLKKYDDHVKKQSKRMEGTPSPMLGKRHNDISKKKISNSVKNSDYHIKLRKNGLSDKEKKHISKYMKGVFTEDWFKNKYGNKKGKKKYIERSESIKKTTYFKEYNRKNKNNYSKNSQNLFWTLYKKLNLEKFKVYFAELNHEYSCSTDKNFDFVLVNKKKIIEYNGNIWHANPKIFIESDMPNPFNEKLTAKDIWDIDKRKNQKVIDNGYDILIIWEDFYKNSKNSCIDLCIKFLIEDNSNEIKEYY